MASNKGSRARSKDNLNAQKGTGGSGQVDILEGKNLDIVSLKSPRIGAFATNGAHPENPFGGELNESPYAYKQLPKEDEKKPVPRSKFSTGGKSPHASGDY